ncbi:MAG: RNA pseudouridine synthase [Verrucomicrobia bacterium]|nr:RNA pseudouridine synthase [Verrucomicrobiota bacterium]
MSTDSHRPERAGHSPEPRSAPSCSPRVVEEFAEWLVIEKPAFMQVHPSKPGDARTLWHHLCELLAFERTTGGSLSIINRLDRETSGLTLVAKTKAAARDLCRQMEARTILKTYTALVFGWPTAEAWDVDAPLLRQGLQRPSRIWLKQCIHPKGSPASTSFRTLARFSATDGSTGRFALLQAQPHTGRMHQIRVHAAASGHPLVGDKIYGEDEACYLEFIDTGWTPSLEARLCLNRHALHAGGLALKESGLSWNSPLPNDIRNFLERLKEEAP